MNRQQGFTLVEVMIVTVIIAILAAIALPSYQRYVRRTVCEDAKGTLVAAASALERYRAQHNSYKDAELAYKQSPATGAEEFKITVGRLEKSGACTDLKDGNVPGDGSSYCLSASPISTGRLQGKSGTLTLDSIGNRKGTGDFATAWESCSGI